MIFPSDPKHKNRGEDDLVAFSWAKFLNNTDDPEWIIFLPMAKAAVRAMDTVEAFLAAGVPGSGYKADMKRWGVAGASKRGWCTWLTAAVVPDRVHAMIPVVFDLLNFTPNIHHMYENYGGWSWALGPYVSEGVMSFLDSP